MTAKNILKQAQVKHTVTKLNTLSRTHLNSLNKPQKMVNIWQLTTHWRTEKSKMELNSANTLLKPTKPSFCINCVNQSATFHQFYNLHSLILNERCTVHQNQHQHPSINQSIILSAICNKFGPTIINIVNCCEPNSVKAGLHRDKICNETLNVDHWRDVETNRRSNHQSFRHDQTVLN